jgi:hypothetical protein
MPANDSSPVSPSSTLGARWAEFLVLALLLLGLAARTRQFVDAPSYWYDEAYLVVNVTDRPYSELIGSLRAAVVIPPLFLILLRFLYEQWGAAEWVMRLPAFVTGIVALFLLIPLARRVGVGRWWLLPVALAAVSHHMLIHAYEVRPYSSDFLLTEAILLTALHCLDPAASPRARQAARLVLAVFALLAPWASFPSVFVLAAVLSGLALNALRHDRRAWRFLAALIGILAMSLTALWWLQARHLYYPGLREHWTQGWEGFPANHAPWTLFLWSARCQAGIGHYGTTGLGIPLALLALVGVFVLGRRSPALALLLAGPIGFGWAAALLGRYPMGDRTVFFAVPCVWLLATAGLAGVFVWLPRRWAWSVPLLAGVLVAPGIPRMAKYVVRPAPRVDFRGAFAYVQRQRGAEDLCWVSHPEVYEVYFGKTRRCLGSHDPAGEVLTRAAGHRLWVVAPPLQANTPGPWDELRNCLPSAGRVAVTRQEFCGLEVAAYDEATMPPGPGPSLFPPTPSGSAVP